MIEARHWEKLAGDVVHCHLCPHECRIALGKRGRCKVRENREGALMAMTYAEVTSVAQDPIEKKPLYHFHPGRPILSIGSYGCNFNCHFCQNHSLSQQKQPTRKLRPMEAVRLAREQDAIGVAYTYNEPLIWFEYLMDCAEAVKNAGLKNVLVTNGFINPDPLAELLPRIDAMNIDIKAFTEQFYQEQAGGALAAVLATAERAARECHVEVTTLVIPGLNDATKELDVMATWIAEHCGRQTPAHLSAYFPRYKLNRQPTSVVTLQHAREIFRKHLDHVYLGNVMVRGGGDTVCRDCGAELIRRAGYDIEIIGLDEAGCCRSCRTENNIVAA